jgi:hypothetical protein
MLHHDHATFTEVPFELLDIQFGLLDIDISQSFDDRDRYQVFIVADIHRLQGERHKIILKTGKAIIAYVKILKVGQLKESGQNN